MDSTLASHSQSVDPSGLSITKEASFSDQDEDSLDLRFILVGQKCHRNEALKKTLDDYGAPVIESDTGYEFMNECEDDTIFVLDNFDGTIFRRLRTAGCRIMGPAAVIKTIEDGESMPCSTRPLYSVSMLDVVVCFTGFKNKEDLSRLAELIHHMGGSIRKEFSRRVTHLVANCTSGEKYRVAVCMGAPVMTDDWVYKAWEERDKFSLKATDSELMNYKLCPFSFSVLAFLGFSREEACHMEDVTVENGGSCVEAGAPSCSHLVIDEHSIKEIPFEVHPRLHIVKSEWFWASIQMDACAEESLYHLDLVMETPTAQHPTRDTPKTLSGGGSRSRKRKRLLKENLAQLASEGEIDTPMYKRRSSEMARMSFSASFLDDTADTPVAPGYDDGCGVEHTAGHIGPPSATQASKEPVKMTARQQTVMELFQTEKNYVGILHTIIKLFKEEIENPSQPGGPLLDLQETKAIFGGVPPIYDVHVKMRDELGEIVGNWSEDKPIAGVVLKHVDNLAKCYPNFVNYFERTKETISRCDKAKPRFHAFLKVCQGKPECGRQPLKELLIRPVQRLPSVMLLLKEIRKRTEPSSEDHSNLQEALARLEEVMTHINEDKRKAEGHQAMFDIINDIENCPANLLSAHRRFITKVDVIDLRCELSNRGDHLTLFIFSDSLAICKRRGKTATYKSPAASHGAKTPQRAFKHLAVISFTAIKRVVDVGEASDCRHTFALIIKQHCHFTETLYAFAMEDEAVEAGKEEFLTTLSRAISDNMCRADYETLLTKVESHVLSLDTSDIGNRTLSRAASKFGKRVSRAFSFNKTPRKMKRAISSVTSMMSPFSSRRESSSFSRNSLTPRSTGSNLVDMRMASSMELSCTSGEENTLQENTYSELVDQMSLRGTPAMSRKHRDTLAMSMDNLAFPDNNSSHGNRPPINGSLTPMRVHYNLRPAHSSSNHGYATIATPLRARRQFGYDGMSSPAASSDRLPRTPSSTSIMSTLSTVSELTYPSQMTSHRGQHYV